MKTQQQIMELKEQSLRHLQELSDKKLEYLFDDLEKFDLYDNAYRLEMSRYMTLCEVLK